MDQFPHCALSGDGALKFAQSQNLDGICNPEELKSDNCPNQILNVTHPQYGEYTDLLYKGRPVIESEDQQLHDTVSAVANRRQRAFSMCKFNRYLHNFVKIMIIHEAGKPQLIIFMVWNLPMLGYVYLLLTKSSVSFGQLLPLSMNSQILYSAIAWLCKRIQSTTGT